MSRATQRVIVKFRASPYGSPQALRELCDQVAQITHGVLVRQPSATGRAVFEVDPKADLDQIIQEISNLPSVEYAERDVIDRI